MENKKTSITMTSEGLLAYGTLDLINYPRVEGTGKLVDGKFRKPQVIIEGQTYNLTYRNWTKAEKEAQSERNKNSVPRSSGTSRSVTDWSQVQVFWDKLPAESKKEMIKSGEVKPDFMKFLISKMSDEEITKLFMKTL